MCQGEKDESPPVAHDLRSNGTAAPCVGLADFRDKEGEASLACDPSLLVSQQDVSVKQAMAWDVFKPMGSVGVLKSSVMNEL